MTEAVELAMRAVVEKTGGPFGAVIVLGGAIVGRGFNRVIADSDPTAHAEVNAIRNACASLGTFSLAGAALYASSEPCPMCLAAIYWARLDRIFFANPRECAARFGFDDAHFYDEISRPAEAREIRMTEHPCNGAELPFTAWASDQTKVPY